jgi:hypothetical protein
MEYFLYACETTLQGVNGYQMSTAVGIVRIVEASRE